MLRRYSVLAALPAIVLAACSTDVVAPLKVPTGPNLALSTGTTSGSYIVLLKGNSISPGFDEKVAALGGTVTYANAKVGFATVSGLPADAAGRLRAISGVADVQADATVSLDSPVPSAIADAALLGDPAINSQANPATAFYFARQWDMTSIHASSAWTAGKLGRSDVTVAILDTGIDYNSLDASTLVDPILSTSFMDTYVPGPTETNLTPAQLAARADDFVRSSFFPTRAAYTDFNGHGTNVASQVSSRATIFSGVTSRTTLMAVKVLGSNGRGNLSQILLGVIYAAEHGADVANLSLGGDFAKAGNGRFVGIINKVFNYARQQGMLIVVAAGNSGVDIQHNGNNYVGYCDSPHVICVAALGPATPTGDVYAPAFYTNYGKSVIDVAAPGGNAVLDADGNPVPSSGWQWGTDIASWVWSMCAKNALRGFSAATNAPILLGCQSGFFIIGYIGTSQAAPHVAGLAALLVAEYGKGNPTLIKDLIESSGDPMDPAFGGALGATRINVQRALGL